MRPSDSGKPDGVYYDVAVAPALWEGVAPQPGDAHWRRAGAEDDRA